MWTRWRATTFHATTMGQALMREIVEIEKRCETCGTATQVIVGTTSEDEEGRRVYAESVDRPAHSQTQCAFMHDLAREEWPTLW